MRSQIFHSKGRGLPMKHCVAVGTHWYQVGDGVDLHLTVHQGYRGQVVHLNVAITNLAIPLPKPESTYHATKPVREDARRAVGWTSLVLVHEDPGSCAFRHFHDILNVCVCVFIRDEQLLDQRQTGKRNLACKLFNRARVPQIRWEPAVTLDLD